MSVDVAAAADFSQFPRSIPAGSVRQRIRVHFSVCFCSCFYSIVRFASFFWIPVCDCARFVIYRACCAAKWRTVFTTYYGCGLSYNKVCVSFSSPLYLIFLLILFITDFYSKKANERKRTSWEEKRRSQQIHTEIESFSSFPQQVFLHSIVDNLHFLSAFRCSGWVNTSKGMASVSRILWLDIVMWQQTNKPLELLLKPHARRTFSTIYVTSIRFFLHPWCSYAWIKKNQDELWSEMTIGCLPLHA